jgi:hypothetical protein
MCIRQVARKEAGLRLREEDLARGLNDVRSVALANAEKESELRQMMNDLDSKLRMIEREESALTARKVEVATAQREFFTSAAVQVSSLHSIAMKRRSDTGPVLPVTAGDPWGNSALCIPALMLSTHRDA